MGKAATEEALLKLKRSVNVIEAYLTGILTDPNDWAEVKAAVEAGYGPQLYPIGYEFVIPHQFMGDSVWTVRHHDYDPLGTELVGGKHNMMLEMKYAYGAPRTGYTTIQYDQREAFYYAENGLSAGTYNFHIQEGYSNWVVGDYQFTLTSAVPAGGQLAFSGDATVALTSRSVQVFANGTSTSAMQNAPITSGNGGTFLGATGVSQSKCDTGFNSLHRASYGSNNYAQSAVRQLLNSDADAGSVWVQKTVFDRIPTWGGSESMAHQGFKKGFDSSFIQAIVAQRLPYITNAIFEIDGFTIDEVYSLQDTFFLLSRPEIYGTYDNTDYKDGTQLQYYTGLADTDRILYDNAGTARYKWLRSPSRSSACAERIVSSATGLIGYANASLAIGIAPACIIG